MPIFRKSLVELGLGIELQSEVCLPPDGHRGGVPGFTYGFIIDYYLPYVLLLQVVDALLRLL